MKARLRTEGGQVAVSESVIAKYAGTAAIECFGVVGMAMVSVTDGIVKLLKSEKLTKGVEVILNDDDHITINFHIFTVYGLNISAIADNLMETVKYKVEEFTGMHVDRINVYVEGVRVID